MGLEGGEAAGDGRAPELSFGDKSPDAESGDKSRAVQGAARGNAGAGLRRGVIADRWVGGGSGRLTGEAVNLPEFVQGVGRKGGSLEIKTEGEGSFRWKLRGFRRAKARSFPGPEGVTRGN
jgi:hypothetical protein